MLRPSDLIVRINTCDRATPYIHQTLATLLSDPDAHRLRGIELIVDSTNTDYLRQYWHLAQLLTIVPQTLEESDHVRDTSVHYRCSYNFYRCFRRPIGEAHGLLVIEDDVIAHAGWVHMLVNAVNEIEADGGVHYVLSLNTHGQCFSDMPTLRRGTWYTSYGMDFYGYQAMYYPTSILPALADHFDYHNNLPDQHEFKPADLAGADFQGRLWSTYKQTEKRAGIYATTIDLFEHAGADSTGLGGEAHVYCSRTFGMAEKDAYAIDRIRMLGLIRMSGVGCQVGVCEGSYSGVLAERLRPAAFHLIDAWSARPQPGGRDVWNNQDQRFWDAMLAGVEQKFAEPIATGRVIVHRGVPPEVAAEFPDSYLDWVYIETDGSYETCRNNLAAYAPKTKRDGYLMGHGYCNDPRYGVTAAVRDFCDKHDWEIVLITREEQASYLLRRL